MKRIDLVIFFIVFLSAVSLYGQVKISDDNLVGIGAEPLSNGTDPVYKAKLYLTEGDLSASLRCAILKVEYIKASTQLHFGVHSTVVPNNGIGYGGFFEGGYRGIFAKATSAYGGNSERSGVVAQGGNGYYNYGVYTSGFGGTKSYGVYSKAYDGTTNYGVYSQATGGTKNFGIYAYTSGGTSNYGIYAYTPSGTNNYAGYFEGNIYCTTVDLGSDRKLKKNIENLESNMLEKLKGVKSRSYEYRTEEYSGLPQGKSFGFVAQELEEIFPELVSSHIMPTPPSAAKRPAGEGTLDEVNAAVASPPAEEEQTETIKTVNYMGMIPVLVEAIQEQQAQIEKQQTEIEELRKLVNN